MAMERDFSSAVAKCRQIIEELIIKYDVPGISFGVSVNGKIVLKEGFGVRNLNSNTPCTSNTVMKIASISKSISSILIGKQLELKNINLDADIRTYLPEIPTFFWQNQEVSITLRQLAAHKAGLRAYKPADNKYGFEEYAITENFPNVSSALKLFINDPLISKPGDLFNYSNHGYTLLSRVLEAITKKPFKQLLNDLFKSINLTSTYIEAENPHPPNCSISYNVEDGHLVDCSGLRSSYKIAAAGLMSTVDDLLVFAHTLINCYLECGLISKEVGISRNTLQTLWASHPGTKLSWNEAGSYCLGWQRLQQDNVLHIGHQGSTIGGSSVLLISFPLKASEDNYKESLKTDDGVITVVILCNIKVPSLGQIGVNISNLFRSF